MRRKGFTLLEFAVVLLILGLLAALLFPLFGRGHGGGNHSSCQTHLKQIGLSVKQYLQDNNEKMPSLQAVAGWRGALMPYLADEVVFQCPAEGNGGAGTSDYWFNARLSGLDEAKMDAQALTVMFGDGYATTDPRTALSQMPKSWIADAKSPAHRHLDGSNFAFADGHTKWLRPEKVTTQPIAAGGSTFSIH